MFARKSSASKRERSARALSQCSVVEKLEPRQMLAVESPSTVAYWRFEEGFADYPGYSIGDTTGRHSLSQSGLPTLRTNVPLATVPQTGDDNKLCVQLGGYSQYYYTNDVPDFQLSSSLTIEASINPTSITSPTEFILFRGDSRPGFDPYWLAVGKDANGKPVVKFQIADATNNSVEISAPIQLNTWSHVAGTLDDRTGTMNIYVNGKLATSIVTTVRPAGRLQDDSRIYVGGPTPVSPGNVNYFKGFLDEVRISNVALPPARLLISSSTGIIAGSVYNDANGNGARDYSEAPIPGLTAYLDQNQNGKLDVGEQAVFTSTKGRYTFSGLSPGKYFVKIAPSGSRQFTWRDANFGYEVSTVDGPIAHDFDFGTTTASLIAGHAFDDRNSNGVLDPSEAPVVDLQIAAVSNGVTIATTTTDANGSWQLAVPYGNGSVKVVLPDNYEAVSPAGGIFTGAIKNLQKISGLNFAIHTNLQKIGTLPPKLYPYGLFSDGQGNFYGITSLGGTINQGTIFKLTKGSSTVQTLHSFVGGADDGAIPSSSLTIDADGMLYGGTSNGGANGVGTVYRFNPKTGEMTVRYSFINDSTIAGRRPSLNLFVDSAGNIFGATNANLASFFEVPAGTNEIKKLDHVLSNGTVQLSGVDMDRAGNMFATTSYVFTDVFEYVKTLGETRIIGHSNTAITGMARDANGNIFGTARDSRSRTIFKFVLGSGQDPVTILEMPQEFDTYLGNPILDAAGNLYFVDTSSEFQRIYELKKGSTTPTELYALPRANNQIALCSLSADGYLYGIKSNDFDVTGSEIFKLKVGDSQTTGSITGKVFNDINGNGKQDVGEPNLAGWTTYLDINDNGMREAVEPAVTTDSKGNYQYTNLPDATYRVALMIQSGFRKTLPVADNAKFSLVGGIAISGKNFGVTKMVPAPAASAVAANRAAATPIFGTGSIIKPDDVSLDFFDNYDV